LNLVDGAVWARCVCVCGGVIVSEQWYSWSSSFGREA
jgi:hypothetical protein